MSVTNARSSALKPAGWPEMSGLVGVCMVVVALGTATRGEDQRGKETDEGGDDTSEAGGHDPTVPHTPLGY